MNADLLYQLSLTLVPQIGAIQAKLLLQHCEPEEIFHAKRSFLEKIEGIGPVRAAAIKKFNDFAKAEAEIKFITQHNITPLFLTDTNYPQRLLNCCDPPTMLYYRGKAALNTSKVLAIIGTRKHSDYAKFITEKIIEDCARQQIMIISGLAFGVDALAHRAALRHQLPTVGVLAHGLDIIYPPDHSSLAKEMLSQDGGLLTEFRSRSVPDRYNFPSRNRIVAGMCDAVIVVETALKGGSMITAELANDYNKDVFAIPGKWTDTKSAGCNQLIKNNKAMLLSCPEDLFETMGWISSKKMNPRKQRTLFLELSADEKIIYQLLEKNGPLHIDILNLQSGLSVSAVAAGILNMELQNVVLSLPGKLYQLA